MQYRATSLSLILNVVILGNWEERPDNSNVEEELLCAWLTRQGHSEKIIGKALHELGKAKVLGGSKNLYDANREVYGLLRYGVKVKPDVGDQNITVWLINWKDPAKNNFAIAEEVMVGGAHDKRPDLVLYVNGIAIGVLELKRSIVSVTEGIRQCLDNQKKEFIRPFFATVQLLMAGNDTEGLRYGVIETPEKYFLTWKEPSDIENPLDRAVSQLCRKERLLEVIHDFVVFDAGTKKTCRHNQYFGVHAAQERIKRREGGIIWHTQGSGKSLTMAFYAGKIIRHPEMENPTIVVLTDRNDLDDQLHGKFALCHELLRHDPVQAESREALRVLLNVSSGGVVFTTIQKFMPEPGEDAL